MNMHYGLHPVDTYVSDFTAVAYQVETFLRLAIKPEVIWYTRNMHELQKPNRTIRFIDFTLIASLHIRPQAGHNNYTNTKTLEWPHNGSIIPTLQPH